MNLVQEMFRLSSAERTQAALQRLSGLFEVMAAQPGFIEAEVLGKTDEPGTLLVLHAWRDLADWQRFQLSDWKVDFMAKRPAGLYDPVPCGMNWRSLQADGAREGALLRREVIRRDSVALLHGEDITGCQTFLYQDALAAFAGCTLRLTRLVHATPAVSDPDALADETYVSLHAIRALQPSVTAS